PRRGQPWSRSVCACAVLSLPKGPSRTPRGPRYSERSVWSIDRRSGARAYPCGVYSSRAMSAETEIRLDVEGMSCASCAARVERGLNKLAGVEASVNLATSQATVRATRPIAVDELVGAVEGAGYGARPSAPAHEHGRAP